MLDIGFRDFDRVMQQRILNLRFVNISAEKVEEVLISVAYVYVVACPDIYYTLARIFIINWKR